MLESGDSLRVDVADHLQLAPKILRCESFNCLPYRFSEGFASFGKLSKSVRLLSAFKGVSARWRRALARLCEQIAPLSRCVETWLILPVVICLSQRLSHACLSVNFYMVKPVSYTHLTLPTILLV